MDEVFVVVVLFFSLVLCFVLFCFVLFCFVFVFFFCSLVSLSLVGDFLSSKITILPPDFG